MIAIAVLSSFFHAKMTIATKSRLLYRLLVHLNVSVANGVGPAQIAL